MAAKTKRKTAISMRNAQAQREPAGRTPAGGSGAACGTEEMGSGTGGSRLGEGQLASDGIVVENFGVAAPLDGGFELAAGFVLAEMRLEEVAEKFVLDGAIGFCFEGLLHLAEQRDVGEGGFAKDGFAGLDVGLGKCPAFGSDDGVAFLDAKHAEKNSRIHGGKKRVDFEAEIRGEAVEIGAPTLIHENFKQARHAARARVRKHDDVVMRRRAYGSRGLENIAFEIGPREHAIDGVNELDKARGLAVSRLSDVHREISVNVSGIAAEDDDAVGENDGFFNIVGDDENGAGGDFVFEPELEQLAAERFGGEHVERGEGLVHEQDFRLDDESTRDANALLHAAGKLFGVGGFKTIESDGVNDAKRALVALDRRHAASFERGFDVFDDGEPGEERETLEDDGDVGRFAAHRLAVPEDAAGGRRSKTGQHAQQGRLAAPRGAEERDDLTRIDGEIGSRDHLDAAAVGLGVKFFKLVRLDDWGNCSVGGAHKPGYYPSTSRAPHEM